MENYLTDNCYNNNTDIKINGVTLHYISAIYIDPKNALDMQTNWNLLFDLNRDKSDRLYYPMKTLPKRIYASYHSLIGRDGSEWLLVPEGKKAYHAGSSSWNGVPNCNMWMYGIGMIGTKETGFTEEQYEAVAKRCAALMKEYGFPEENIAGHEQVSPGRKYDPGIATGNFNLTKFMLALQNAKAAQAAG